MIEIDTVFLSCRVATHCEENKMPIPSLAKVFGPTIVGHSSPNPDPATIWKETNLQPKVSVILYSTKYRPGETAG